MHDPVCRVKPALQDRAWHVPHADPVESQVCCPEPFEIAQDLVEFAAHRAAGAPDPTVIVTIFDFPPKVPVIVTDVCELIAPAVKVNVLLIPPFATTTDAGTEAAEVLLLLMLIKQPAELRQASVSCTAPVTVWPEAAAVGLTDTDSKSKPAKAAEAASKVLRKVKILFIDSPIFKFV